MNKKIVLTLASSLLIITVILAAYILSNIANTTTTVYVDPDNIIRSIGQDFTVNISISNVANLYAWECKLGWNAAVLDLVNLTEGSFLKKIGSTLFNYRSNETFGHIVIDCTLLGDVAGVNGSGVLASIRLHVNGEESCELALYDTKLIDVSEQMIAHTANGSHFSADI